MEFERLLRPNAGVLVQPVDVLGDEGGEPALTLELDKGLVARLGRASRMAGQAANFWRQYSMRSSSLARNSW